MELRDLGRYMAAMVVLSIFDLIWAIGYTLVTGVRHEMHTSDLVIIACAYAVIRAIRERKDAQSFPS